jgi:hypothetical protein
VLTLAALLAPVGRALAGDLEDLREENAELRQELDAARAEIRELRSRLEGGAAPAAGRPAKAVAPEAALPASGAIATETALPASTVATKAALSASGAVATETAARVETDLVPVRRVRLQVEGSSTDPSRLESEWMPARDGLRVLESIRLQLVQSDEGLTPRLALARTATTGSLSGVESATLVIDGTTVTCPRVGFTENRRQRQTMRGATTLEREQIALFAIPAEDFARISRAKDVAFTAGPTRFDWTDEHLAAAGALAARRQRTTASR